MRSPFARDDTKRAAELRQAGEAASAPFGELVAEAERIASSVMMGVHGQRKRGLGETFWEYRHHRTEDGAAAVDWRMSAKSADLYVRENEQESANTVWLWRDGSATMNFASSRELPLKKDRAAVCMIAMSALLSRGGERVAVLGESTRARSGELGLERTSLRLATGPGSLSSVEAAPIFQYGRVVLASDFLDPIETWRARLSRYAAMQAGGALLRIIDPMEEDFPFKGRTKFEAVDDSDHLLFGRAEEARKAYRARWQEHGDRLADLARAYNWTLVTHRTDRPATQAVLALYRALAREV